MSEAARPPLSVFVSSDFIPEVRRDFAERFDTTFEDTRRPASALARHAGVFDALVVSLETALPAEQIHALPESVRALATYSVGTDHIDCEAASTRGIAVFNTPGVLSDSVAENALFLMLGAARRATESIELLRSRHLEDVFAQIQRVLGDQIRILTVQQLGVLVL